MVELQNQKQTQILEPIHPEKKRGIFVGVSFFDDVWRLSKVNKDRYVQAYADLPGIFRDKRYFDKIVNRYGFTSDQQLSLIEPRIKHCNEMTNELGRLFKSNPHETVFALFCYSSHGMI